MNKKGLGLSIGLASVIAVGTFVSPYMSSTTLTAHKTNVVKGSNTHKYSTALKTEKNLSKKFENQNKEKALNEIRNAQVRNVLNDSNKSNNKRAYVSNLNNTTTLAAANNSNNTERNNDKKIEHKNVVKKTTVNRLAKTDLNNESKKIDVKSQLNHSEKKVLKAEKAEVAALTLSRDKDSEEEKIYSNITKSTTGDLFVREKADKNSEVIGVLPKDSKVVIKDNDNNEWAKIQYKNKEAYISKDYLSNKKLDKNDKTEPAEASKSAKKAKQIDMWVKSPVYLRSDKSINSRKSSVLQKNTKISGVIEDGWFKTTNNGKVGYVSINYLSNKKIDSDTKKIESTRKVNLKNDLSSSKKVDSNKFEGSKYTGYISESVNVRDKDSMDSNVVSVLEKGSKITGLKNKHWIKLSDGKFISSKFVQDNEVVTNDNKSSDSQNIYSNLPKTRVQRTNESGSGSAIAQAAYNYLGEKYVWGSAQPGVGFDCSGLTSYLYNKVCGVSLYRNSAAQSNNGYPVSKDNLKQGDLLFFSTNGSGSISHVGIYVGNGKMIHASTPATGVIISDIDSNYYSDTFVTARRILN
ncbi:C40 family peptidase [uncultured Finegoldia sp.]|uniref:C40 family peptidase n=1 Tax=uncultured Finegoldia sp. TaxID=328009 RepID=UPI00260BBFAE|nr:C40 family peptidase [uncultured Finegoldia sp.]